MSRARNIKPGFFTNDDLVELPFEVRLLFIGLWTIADRAGRLIDRPKKIKMEIFPGDDVDCHASLSLLQAKGFLKRYEIQGIGYIQITNWHKHQNPHIKETPSVIPAENESAPDIPVQAPEIPERSVLIPDSLNLIPDSLSKAISAKPDPMAGFDSFWQAYPSKKAKPAAQKAWKRMVNERPGLDVILAAIEQHKASAQWADPQFIPHPATWINQTRWNDTLTQAAKKHGSDLKHDDRKQFLDALTGGTPNERTIEGTARAVGSGNLQADEPALRLHVSRSVA